MAFSNKVAIDFDSMRKQTIASRKPPTLHTQKKSPAFSPSAIAKYTSKIFDTKIIPSIALTAPELLFKQLTDFSPIALNNPPASPLRGREIKRSAKTTGSIGVVALGSLLALSIPKLALAGTLGGSVLAIASSPLGLMGLVGGGLLLATFYIKYMFGFDKTMDKRNDNVGDPTLKNQIIAFSFIPMSIITGSGLCYLGSLLLPWGITPSFLGIAAVGIGVGTFSAVKSIYQSFKIKQQTITPGFKSNLRQIFETNLLSHAVQGAEAAYMFYRGATVFEIIIGAGAFAAKVIGATSLASLGAGVLWVGVPLFLLGSFHKRFVAHKMNEAKTDFGPRYDFSSARGRRAILFTALGSAVLGVTAWCFAMPAVNITLALAFFFVETHALIHNWSGQSGSREIIASLPEEYAEAEVWRAARRPTSPHITMIKPGFGAADYILPTNAIIYLRKGVNMDFSLNFAPNMGMPGEFKDAYVAFDFLRQKEAAILDLVDARHDAIIRLRASGGTLTSQYRELARLYEDLAKHWQVEAQGNFSTLSVTPYAGKSDVYSCADASQAERYYGQAIAWEGEKFQRQADSLMGRTRGLSEAEIDEHLQALEKQYSIIFHIFAPKQFRNYTPDVIKSKIREIDLFNHLTDKVKHGASILRRNRLTGEFYWELVPAKRGIRFNPSDNTKAWRNRPDTELHAVESNSDIAYFENSTLPDPLPDNRGRLHLRSSYTYGPNCGATTNLIVFKNPTETHDEVVWVPGMQLDPAIAAQLPKEWKRTDGQIDEAFTPGLIHFFESRYQTMCDGEHADINTSDFLAPLERDIKKAFAFVMWRVPEKTTVPNPMNLRGNNDPQGDLRESQADRLVRISASYAPFGLQVTEAATGKRLTIPYNWAKTRNIPAAVWSETHSIRLMTREDFKAEYGKEARDNHGDKLPYVIVPLDASGKKLGKPELVLPYSYFLGHPTEYSEAQFDRTLGRIGNSNFNAYTFERSDGTRYMRWLPREEDWPEMEFGEQYQTHEIKGKEIVLHACRWIGKRFNIDDQQLAINAGQQDSPNFKITAIERDSHLIPATEAASCELLQALAKSKGRQVLVRFTRSQKNNSRLTSRHYVEFRGKVRNMEGVVAQRICGDELELIRIQASDKRVIELGTDQQLLDGKPLMFPSTWINATRVRKHPSDSSKVDVELRFKNPYSGADEGTQLITMDRKLFPDIEKIYQHNPALPSTNADFVPAVFDQRQKRPEVTGLAGVENKLFLTFYTHQTTSVPHGLSLAPGEEIKLVDVQSVIRVKHLNDTNGVPAGTVEWVPLNHELPKASRSSIHFDHENHYLSSGLVFGREDTRVAPQHLVPIRSVNGGPVDDLILAPLLGAGLAGAEAATDDQKYYFGECDGEYNFYDGWIAEQRMPALGSRGPWSLQYAKSIRGAALNTGSNTVMRSPHLDLLFPREELEVYAVWNGRNYMPVPLLKSLFTETSTTEDAKGAMEKRAIFDLATTNDRTVRSIGASVNNIGEGIGQRGRWAAMLQFLSRVNKMLSDEIVRARILKQIPPQFTTKQLHEWFNTYTWYLDTTFKHIVPLVPLAYSLGLSTLPAGVVFPLFWFMKTFTGWPKYSADNQKVGVARVRSYFRNLALNYLYMPGISRNVSHIVDEAKGPFMSTAGSGDSSVFPWALRRLVYYFGGLSALQTGLGVYKMTFFGLTAFGLGMNVIWPAFMLLGVTYAIAMLIQEINYRFNTSDPTDKRAYMNKFKNKAGVPSKWEMLKKELLIPLTIDFYRDVKLAFQRFIQYQKNGTY
ncbi:MAG: hypothetical protein WC890_07425 [Candidatus Margulisiibacteriota bacterium]